MSVRDLREEESLVLKALLELAPMSSQSFSLEGLRAVDLPDGGMGSIRLVYGGDVPRRMGRELVIANYFDEDKVPVLISINLDEADCLFEIDFWRVDYKPLKRYPLPGEIQPRLNDKP